MKLEDLILRPLVSRDLETLSYIAKTVGTGFTSIPDNQAYLEQKVERVIASFQGTIEPKARLYLFVLEDIRQKKFAGLCGIEAMIGYGVPFYNYKISTITQVCESLKKYIDHEIIQIVNDFQESSELVSLFLDPAYRGQRRGELLSRSRFLFIAQFPQLFSNTVVAEIRGISDTEGQTPFWDQLGRPFFDMAFREADFLTTVGGKQFISDLMPRYPIFLDLLSTETKTVIGQPHPDAMRAKKLLENEGLAYDGYIDIFDGGPLIGAKTDNIFTISHSFAYQVGGVVAKIDEGQQYMIANQKLDFRLILSTLQFNEHGEVLLTAEAADNLQVTQGDPIRFIKF